MEITKEHIQEQYKVLKNKLGYQPSSKKFYSETSISERTVLKLFRSYSKLVELMGDSPKSFGEEGRTEDEFWIIYGNVVRNNNKIPTTGDWEYNNYKPTVTSYLRKFKLKWTELPTAFRDYISDKPEWKDILHLLPNSTLVKPHILPIHNTETLELKYSQFLPPILDNVLELSISEEKSKEFEEKVNLIFQMLCFEIEVFGQGKGRHPDGIAKSPQFRYSVIIDAKARKDFYKIGQEDRKFIEYINTHKTRLYNSGYEIIYFLIVSSSFNTVSEIALNNILRDTNIQTTLIHVKDLLKILARKIESPNKFGLDKLKNIFIQQGLITDKQISELYKS